MPKRVLVRRLTLQRSRVRRHRDRVRRKCPRPTPRRAPKVSNKSAVAARENKGRIARSSSAKADFMKQTGYPKGRKGYVVDHIVPLECGGADIPSNMQWQTVQEAKIKDRTERNCRRE